MYSITFDMSRWIVSQRWFSRKKSRHSFKKMLNRSWISFPEFKIEQKIKKYLSRWIVFILSVIIWTLILIKLLFFKSWQTISQIKFSEDTLATYQDIELFNLISSEVKWKNYYMILSDKDSLLSNIQKEFPFVWKIDLQLESPQEEISHEQEKIAIWINLPLLNWTWEQNWTWKNLWTWIQIIQTNFPLKLSQKVSDNWWTLWIQLMYYEPTILIKLNDKKYAVWNEDTYVEMKDDMLLWIRVPSEDNPNPEQLLTIETPQYLSWTTSLEWFFFEISLEKMIQIAKLAKEEFWNNMLRFVYLTWSTRFAIFTSDYKVLYFNFPEWWNIEDQWNSQIFKYNTLREKYEKFWNIEKIDLWSLENNKTIIKNY